MTQINQDFNGSFTENCQLTSVPQSLLSMIYMLTGSTRNKSDDQGQESFKPALSIAQLVQFNSLQNRRNVKYHRYCADKETPLSIYIAFLVHSETRSRVLIDKFHDLGLCISYHRMLSLSTSIGNTVCSQFQKDNIVCPSNLKFNLFTTYAVDNIDHNPSSRSAKDSFHGTAITTTQHLENASDGYQRPQVQFEKSEGYTLHKLPSDYTTVRPFVLKTKDVYVYMYMFQICKRKIFGTKVKSQVLKDCCRSKS